MAEQTERDDYQTDSWTADAKPNPQSGWGNEIIKVAETWILPRLKRYRKNYKSLEKASQCHYVTPPSSKTAPDVKVEWSSISAKAYIWIVFQLSSIHINCIRVKEEPLAQYWQVRYWPSSIVLTNHYLYPAKNKQQNFHIFPEVLMSIFHTLLEWKLDSNVCLK